MHYKKKLLIILIVISASLITACAATGGGEASDFTLPNLEGEQMQLADYLGEKPVLIKFWTIGCSSCTEALPDIQQAYEENQGRAHIITINVSHPASIVNQFMDDNNYDFPVLIDDSFEVASQYLVSSVPKVLLIDKSGAIKFEYNGSWTRDQINNVIEREL